MIPTTDWEPTPADVLWQESWIRAIKDGGVWGIPANKSAFKFNKKDKTFCLISGDPNHETNRRVAKILKMLNYTEVVNTEEQNGDNV